VGIAGAVMPGKRNRLDRVDWLDQKSVVDHALFLRARFDYRNQRLVVYRIPDRKIYSIAQEKDSGRIPKEWIVFTTD
jgi:hypothetical protein